MLALSSISKLVSLEASSAHDREEDRHGEAMEILRKLEQHFIVSHVGTRPAEIPVYDWEQVQLNKLAEMLAHPEDGEVH